MTALFSLTFQGKVTSAGGLHPADERDVARAAFPLSPPRDAALREGYLAFKMTPLASGRMLFSAVANRGDVDGYKRPVLRAVGCVAELSGALRDPAAAWEALRDLDPDDGVEVFEARVAERSIHASPEAFERFRSELERAGAFHAQAAAVLAGELADLYVGEIAAAPERLRPTFGLLTLDGLRRLELAIGGEPSDLREPVLGFAGGAPDELRQGGFLAGLLGRRKDTREGAAVDFRSREVFGSRARGPAALAAAIADRRPWPVELAGHERYRVLLRCLDEGRSPFDVVPELAELRRAVARLEDLSKDLARGR